MDNKGRNKYEKENNDADGDLIREEPGTNFNNPGDEFGREKILISVYPG